MKSFEKSALSLMMMRTSATWPFNEQGDVVFGKLKKKREVKTNIVTDCFCVLYLHLQVSPQKMSSA